MPFISLLQKDLQKVLNICNQISPKKSDIEIFTFTKVSIENNVAQFSSINPNVFFKTDVKMGNSDTLENRIEFLIKTDIFASSVALIHDEMVGLDIDLDKTTMYVQGAKSKHTLRINTQLLSDFLLPQENPEELEAQVSINAEELIDANKVAFTTVGQPKNVYQPEFLSICYSLKKSHNQLVVVSCDKYRISKTHLKAEFTHASEGFDGEITNFLIQPKGLQLLASSLNGEENLELNFEKNYLWVKFGDSTLTLRYGDGKFPDYEKIIPQSFTCTFLLNTKDLLDSLKQVYLMARTNVMNKSVVLTMDPGQKKVTFTAKTDDGYASESSLSVENYEGIEEVWNQSFNADYLMDYIGNVGTDTITFEANPGKPLVMSPEHQKARQLCLVQGLR
jgi:DNA polymerase III sliding clamp (beta) subunit (PCNA family)